MAMSDYYKKLREKLGSELIFMPSVAGIVIVRNELGEILFQNKGNGEKWSLPAGAIELGETPAEAIVREIWEETGLYVTQRSYWAYLAKKISVINTQMDIKLNTLFFFSSV